MSTKPKFFLLVVVALTVSVYGSFVFLPFLVGGIIPGLIAGLRGLG